MPTLLIGEAANCGLGSFYLNKLLARTAKWAKCDIVKFQLFNSKDWYSKFTPDFANYKNVPKLIQRLEFPRRRLQDLKNYCDDIGIEFLCTPFDERSIEDLVDVGVKRLKIAGFEATDPRFVKLCAKTKLPLIVSIGIGFNVTEYNINNDILVEEFIQWVLEENSAVDLTLLHCNHAYPTPLSDIRLQCINILKKHNTKVGFSDHTKGILVPPLAIMYGASVIEKHFTLLPHVMGPDSKFAINPLQLRQMVKNIRAAEKCISYRVPDSQQPFLAAMRSVIAKKDIKIGEELTTENITTKRPRLKNSIPADRFYDTLGKTCMRDIVKDTILLEDMVY